VNLYVTGFKSFFSSIIRNNLSEFNLYEIKSLTDSNSNNMRFELNLDVLNNQDTYIMHAAWNMKERNIKKSHSINVLGSKLFFDSLSQDQKKRFIFISSTSAFKNTDSVYGMHKFEVENYVLKNGGSVIKCGLIVNEQDPFSGGFFSELYNLAKKTPVIPNFTGNKKIFEITDSLELKRALNNIGNSNLIDAYKKEIYTFKELVNEIMKLDKKIINLPMIAGIYVAKLFNFFKIPLGLNIDSLLSLRSKLKTLK
tara:strand:- start:892 stop:1653 length:762 start_codon:yes stop_codon:yes gene_type:complete